jgi:hypothetical protein
VRVSVVAESAAADARNARRVDTEYSMNALTDLDWLEMGENAAAP